MTGRQLSVGELAGVVSPPWLAAIGVSPVAGTIALIATTTRLAATLTYLLCTVVTIGVCAVGHATLRRHRNRKVATAPEPVAGYAGRRAAGVPTYAYTGIGTAPPSRTSRHNRRTVAARRAGLSKETIDPDLWTVVGWWPDEASARAAERNRIATLGPLFGLVNKHKRHDFGQRKTHPDASPVERFGYVVADLVRLWWLVFLEPMLHPAATVIGAPVAETIGASSTDDHEDDHDTAGDTREERLRRVLATAHNDTPDADEVDRAAWVDGDDDPFAGFTDPVANPD